MSESERLLGLLNNEWSANMYGSNSTLSEEQARKILETVPIKLPKSQREKEELEKARKILESRRLINERSNDNHDD